MLRCDRAMRGGLRGPSRGMASLVFDRALKRHHRECAALCPEIGNYGYLRDEVANVTTLAVETRTRRVLSAVRSARVPMHRQRQ